MQGLTHWLENYDLFGISLVSISMAVAAALLSYGLMRFAIGRVVVRLQQLTRRTATGIDDMVLEVLAGTSRWLILVAALMIGASVLDLGEDWGVRVGHLWFVALAIQLGLWCTRAIAIAVKRYQARHRPDGDGQLSASAALLSWFLRTILWAVILLAVLSNLGVNITAFVASLGVGGVAIALAVQSILGDLFASLAIAVDKPFEVGDYIGTPSGQGTVEYVGLKTTHIRSLSGEQVIISNTELLKQPLKNFKRMHERRIAFRFGITYGTPAEKVESIPDLIRRLVEADETLRFARTHFTAFGDSSLDFEVVYFVRDASYDVYMDAQHRLNLRMLKEFAAAGIEFAFPTRTVLVTRAQTDESAALEGAAAA
jgi:small-conductance mechanosensitive channel